MQFSDMIGQQILVISKFLDASGNPVEVKLTGEESGGIWIENDHLFKRFTAASAEDEPLPPGTRAPRGQMRKGAFFLPFHQIDFVIRQSQFLEIDL
jgi:hypothetical protein